MKKRHQLEDAFNEMLKGHELIVKFNGDNEIVIIGAPVNNVTSRLLLSGFGVFLVSFCLIKSAEYHNTVIIGGALLGLIFTATPFISFYSKKHFRVLISNRIKQVNIMKSALGPYTRIDFSNIDHFRFKRVEVDDFVSPDLEIPVTYQYTLIASTEGREVELFTINSKFKHIEKFTEKFTEFLSKFTRKSTPAPDRVDPN